MHKKRKCCIHNATQYICSLYRTCHISSAHCTITHNMMFIHKTQVYVHTYIHTEAQATSLMRKSHGSAARAQPSKTSLRRLWIQAYGLRFRVQAHTRVLELVKSSAEQACWVEEDRDTWMRIWREHDFIQTSTESWYLDDVAETQPRHDIPGKRQANMHKNNSIAHTPFLGFCHKWGKGVAIEDGNCHLWARYALPAAHPALPHASKYPEHRLWCITCFT